MTIGNAKNNASGSRQISRQYPRKNLYGMRSETVSSPQLSYDLVHLTLNRPGGGGAESAHRPVLPSAVLKR